MSDIERLRQAEQMLAQIASVPDAVQVIDYAAAAKEFAERAKLGEAAQNHALTIRLRAEKRLAEIVDAAQRVGQVATRGGSDKIVLNVRDADHENDHPSSLDDLGVKKQRLAEARQVAKLSDGDITSMADQASAEGRALSRREVIEKARERDPESFKPTPQPESGWDVLDAIQNCAAEMQRAVRIASQITGMAPEGQTAVQEYVKQVRAGADHLLSLITGGITDSALAEWMAGE